MVDVVSAFVKPIGKAITEKTKQSIVKSNADHYNLDEIKSFVLDVLSQIKEDTTVLRNVDFKTARNTLASWQQSDEPIDSEVNKDRLRDVSIHARRAFDTVPDELDKIAAASFLILADYHRVALKESPPNWLAGKKEAQNLLKQYTDLLKPQLTMAAKHEMKTSMRSRVFGNKDKRRRMLQSYVTLSLTVLELVPTSVNGNHPRLDQVEAAAAKMVSSPNVCCSCEHISPKIHHLLSQPQLGTTLEGHTWTVYCCAIFANDTRVLSGSEDNTLKVWDLTNGQELHTLEGHTDRVRCCAVFASDTRAISGSFDEMLKVWDLASGQELYTLQGQFRDVTCCAVYEYANDARAISGSKDRTLKVWDLTNQQELYTLEGHKDWVTCCTLFANGTQLISGSGDKTLKVWDLKNGQKLYDLHGHTKTVQCCAVYANDTRAITGSKDMTLKVWDLTKQQKLYTHEAVLSTSWVGCCGAFGNVHGQGISGIIDDITLTGQELYTLEGHTNTVMCCAVFANDTYLISGSDDKTLKVWDLRNGQELHTLEGHTGPVECCTMSASGTRVISGSSDKTIGVWLLPSTLTTG